MEARRIFLGNDLNGLCSLLRSGPPSRAPALRILPSRRQVGDLLPGAISQAQYSVGLMGFTCFAVRARVLAGQTLIGGTITGCRQVMSDPTRQVEQICRSTARLNPACPHEEPHTVVLVSPTRVCLVDQSRARTSSTSRSEEPIYWVVLRRRQSAHVLASLLCAPHPPFGVGDAIAHAWGLCSMLVDPCACCSALVTGLHGSVVVVIRMAFGCPA